MKKYEFQLKMLLGSKSSKLVGILKSFSRPSESFVKTSVSQARFVKKVLKTELLFQSRSLASTPADITQPNLNTPETINDDIPLSPLPPDMEELCKGNVEIGKQIRKILMEYEMLKLTAYDVPSTLTAKHMKALLELRGAHGRQKLFRALFLKELHPKLDKEKKEKKRLERVEAKENKAKMSNGHIDYGLNANTIFFYIQPNSMNRWYTHRQSYALQFGQPLVIDLGFEKNMTRREVTNLVDQLAYAHSENKINKEPFNLYFTNVDYNSQTYSLLKLGMPQIIDDVNNMITVTDKSYLDIFLKKKLVYLSPDASTSLSTFDHDAVYIIGGIVDRSAEEPLTLAKAKRERVEMAKLPLAQHVLLSSGTGKALTLNHMMKILLQVKTNQNWKEALLTGLPKRALKRLEDIQEEDTKMQQRFLQGQKKVARRQHYLERYKAPLMDKKLW